ncbi:dicarboxylate/amino acid:cation symporter [Clostridium botulinum]|uniref:Sodium:dicarboxylate symporter family protein n=1 Tax=Clostridium botulinum (strain Eklund 17B / Type B) TaxID=935198 RepID=B2THD1_CLOBB|nr:MULTISPECIES: dicarboxylate/amino acid:cation symporter [Clostridium]ACD24914.1 sodium:dicarboxylate symporter family protein [Clostridium botulinum B str. Eklund 17B (NRP)]KFX59972.1 sodium:proton antiporter [Clostridium botulinum]MBN1043788.1 dicarboxylate/amino acid:cation symporter [Clostridium botulinum]MBN1050475.1 dicarboxylate/amino acid:cation symporter [Clostridium botulinum]MBN1053761.1 dicarboxylate/amino acid:cation symporter [Clostridium botulinum]
MKNLSLIKRIFTFLILGIILGLTCRSLNIIFPIRILATFSALFGSFLSFVIPLIIIAFIVPGIASLGKNSGKVLIGTTILAYISTIISGIAAYFIGISFLPKLIKAATLVATETIKAEPYFTIDIPPMLNIMSALIFAFIFGIGLSKITNSSLLRGFQEFSSIVSMIISKVLIPLVPLYIAAIFSKLSLSGEIFTTIKSFATIYLILFILQFAYLLCQYSIAGGLKKENPFKLLKNMIPAYLTAVGTQSSAATIPVTLSCTKENNVSEEVADLVVPLCATIHLAGDTITLVLTSIGVMLMRGETPTLITMMPFILMLGVTMVAAPGVPGGGVMAALGLLESMLGFGNIEKPIMIALHAAQDSFGTATNITGDGALSLIIDYFVNKNKSK